jgi:TonB family protein
MTSVSIAGRYSVPSRLGPAPRRRPAPAAPHRLSLAALGISCVAHVLVAVGFVFAVVWNNWNSSRVYVVNLVPTVAAVGSPTAAAHKASLPAPPAPTIPSRAPTATPTPAPRERPMREAPRLPEPSLPRPDLPPRLPAPLRAGEKELPSLARSPGTSHPEKARLTERPVESRPAPEAPRGLPTGSPAGVGARSLDTSDFPYAWYLRQVLQKVEGEWQRQNQRAMPVQKPLVLVEIQRDGSIRMPRIDQSSGNTLYDQAAIRAVLDASPFPPLPQDWSRPSLRVQFRFDLERG